MHSHEPPLSIPELIVTARTEAARPVQVNGESDRFYGMWMNAFADTLQGAPAVVHNDLIEAVELKRERSPYPAKFVLNWFLRRGQMNVIHDPEYPSEDPDYYRDVYEKLLLRGSERGTILTYDMQQWNVGSDVENRVAGLLLALQLLRPDSTRNTQEPLRILNGGSARDHAGAVISANVQLDEVKVRDLSPNGRAAFSKFINQKLSEQVLFDTYYGLDLWQIRDEMWSDFLESCRFYPLERLDPCKRARYPMLEAIRDNDPRMHHVAADLTLLNRGPSIHNGWREGTMLPGYYDVGFLGTCLHQNYPKQQAEIFANFHKLTKDDAMIVVQDFCRVVGQPDAANPISQVEFHGPPAPGTIEAELYPYRTLVFDKRQPEKGLQVLATWNNGRCESFSPGPLLLKAAAEFTTVPAAQTQSERIA